jgi:segregation and condensation protein B
MASVTDLETSEVFYSNSRYLSFLASSQVLDRHSKSTGESHIVKLTFTFFSQKTISTNLTNMTENRITPIQNPSVAFGEDANLSSDDIKSILEAILFAANEPIALKQFSALFEGVSTRQLRQLLMQLRDEYQASNRSFQLVEIANGFQICTRPEYHNWIERFYTRQVRVKLTPSALETLAIVAYKQPTTRSEVEDIRGVNSDSVLNSLVQKGLVRIAGRKPGPGRSLLFATTDEFLQQFGLKDLSELPSIEEIEELLNQAQQE